MQPVDNKKGTILHRTIASHFKDFSNYKYRNVPESDPNEKIISQANLRFILQFKFRIPKHKIMSVIDEFIVFGYLIREGQQQYYLNEKLIRSEEI